MNPTWLLVGAVYAAFVAICRRLGADLPRRTALFFYAVVLLFLWKPLTGPYIDVPADYVRYLPPWVTTSPTRPANTWINDVALQMVPWAHQVRESWKALTVPLWNARAGCGYPLLANGQSSALSILRLIALPLPLGQAMTAEAAFKFLLALSCMFLFCRRWKMGIAASTVGALGYSFGTFMNVWLHFPHTTVACFLPAAFLAGDLLAEQATYRRFVVASVIWAVIVLGGHPETATHIFVLWLPYLVWLAAFDRRDVRRSTRFRNVIVSCAAVATGALIAAPFLVTFGETVTKSERYAELHAIPPDDNGSFTDFASAVMLFEPHYYGEIPIDATWGPAHPESITGFSGILGLVGFLTIAIRGLVRRKLEHREVFLLLATVAIVGVILDWPLVGFAFQKLLSLAANRRIRLLLAFLLAIQAAYAVDLLVRRASERMAALPVLLATTIVSATFLLFMLPDRFPKVWMQWNAALALLPSMIVLALLALVAVSGRGRPAVTVALVVAVGFEMWFADRNWNPVLEAHEIHPRSRLIEKLMSIRAATRAADPFRVVGLGPMFFPNVSAFYGLDDIRAHDPMANARYLGVLRAVGGHYDPTDYFAMWKDIDSPLINLLNVRYVIARADTVVQDQTRYEVVYDGADGKVLRNRDEIPRFFAPPAIALDFVQSSYVQKLISERNWANVAILRRLPVDSDQERNDLLAPRPASARPASLAIREAGDTEYRLSVDAPRYSLIASSIAFWPGWHVSSNGRPLVPIQVDGAFLGFVVPPGHGDVRVWYAPLSFRIGVAISLLTITALVALSRKSLRFRLRAAARWE